MILILQGIKDFEEKVISNGFRHSSIYDVVFQGKNIHLKQ